MAPQIHKPELASVVSVRVANYASRLEAEMAGELLKNAGIPCIIQSSHPGILGASNVGFFPPGAALRVSADDLAQAREILDDAGMLHHDDVDAPEEDGDELN